MARTKQALTAADHEKVVSHSITVRDSKGDVVGRAEVEVGDKVFVTLIQTFGGAREGTLTVPTRCDLDVLQKLCDEAERLAGG